MKENGFEPRFPAEVTEEVGRLRKPSLRDAMDAQVSDLRSRLWSSIDNRSSRDLDQIEVAERLPNDVVRLCIAIADVDVLVPKDSATDTHAAGNTTSVYTGPIVFPMLPEKLSTDLTSLNEGQDRRAVVVEMDIAADGTVVREDVYRAVVLNHAKLVYESVAAWMEGQVPGDLRSQFARIRGLEEQLVLQREAAERLRSVRERAGALSLESVEAQPVVVAGRIVDIVRIEQNRARDIIESYMVAANGAMARFLDSRRVPSIRRIVRSPKRWDRLVALAADMGETLPEAPDSLALAGFLAKRKAADPRNFPDLSLSVVKLLGPGEYILERRMKTDRRDGHFGLAVTEYTHSTAPNRRYVDLVTQRIAKDCHAGVPVRYSEAELMEVARRCTEMEDAARKVERSMRKKAAAAWMRDRVGESFMAIVTGASPKGTYVRLLSPPIEGRVVRGAPSLDVGDTVQVTLVVADPIKGHIDFTTAESDVDRKLARSRRKKAMAASMASRVGESFDAEVTGASDKGTYVRLADPAVEGRVMRGQKGMAVGDRVRVKLADVDPVHGFIDFENAVMEPRKVDRIERKRQAAALLRERVGETFDAEITGVTKKATWVRLIDPPAEGRLVRGGRGQTVGARVRVLLLFVDPARGFVDFALEPVTAIVAPA